jgi:hypothetical protein
VDHIAKLLENPKVEYQKYSKYSTYVHNERFLKG